MPADERARAILEKHFGDRLNAPQIGSAMEFSLEELANFVPHLLTKEKLKAIDEDLAKLRGD